MNRIRGTGIRCLLVLLLQILSFSLYAQSTIAGLNAELGGMYKKYKLPGFSIVIVHKDKILYENGYGYADIKTKTPFTPATIQNIGSVSKTFVAVAMMKGGLRTSADELGKYMIGMIKGFYGKSDILSQKHYREMFSPQLSAANPPENIDLSHRNKGVFWNLYKNGYIGHTGGDPGVSTCLSFNPQTKTGFAFLTNIMTGNETISREVQSIQKVLEDFCNNISRHK